MSIHTTGTHTRRDDTTAHLEFAYSFVTAARLDERLTPENGPANHNPDVSTVHPAPPTQTDGDPPNDTVTPAKRGRQATYMAYTATAIACVVYELVASSRPYTIKEILDAIWFRYTPDQLAIIGLDGMRTPERVAQMSRPANPTPAQRLAADKAENAEYQRLWQAIRNLFAAMDDTPLVANNSADNRPTIRQVAAAAANPDLTPKTKLKHDIVNALIAAALHAHNKMLDPATTLHGPGGILEDHEGHLAVDETHLAVGAWGLTDHVAPGNYMARTFAHGKIYKGAPSLVGLTLAVAVARPNQPHDVPTLCLGATLHHPTGGLGTAVLNVVDAIDTNGVRAPRRSNINQQVVGDGGYTESADLNRGLTNRRYGIVIKYKKGQRTLHEIQAIRHDDGTVTPGIRLYNGTPLCPGASIPALSRTDLQVPDFYTRKTDTTPNPITGPELAAREATLATILPFVMSTSGRPQEVADRRRGGQTKNTPPLEPVMRVTLTCPWVKNTARCAIFSDYHDPAKAHLPAVPAPPTHLPFHQRPTCCENDSGTIQARIPLPEYKDWQDFMPGTWEHSDWYAGPRAANERFNARLKHTTGGSNLNRNAIGARKAAVFALFTAMAIVNANRTIVESWNANLARNQARNDASPAAIKPNIKPTPKAHENKKRRDQTLKAYQAQKRRNRTP